MLDVEADILESLSIPAVSIDESCRILYPTRSLMLVYIVMTRAIMTNIILMVYTGRHRGLRMPTVSSLSFTPVYVTFIGTLEVSYFTIISIVLVSHSDFLMCYRGRRIKLVSLLAFFPCFIKIIDPLHRRVVSCRHKK
jgi:hypothetical protein